MELSVDRVNKDMIEIQHFGYSATDIYVDYRIAIDSRIKRLMIDISEAHEEMGFKPHELEVIRNSLLTNYREFWSLIEPHMRAFYEELQKTLDISKNDIPELVSEKNYTKKEIEDLEKDIKDLQIKVLREEYYLKCLQNYEKILNKQTLPLQDLSKKLSKIIEGDMKKNQKDIEKICSKVRMKLCKVMQEKSDSSFLYKKDEKKMKEIEDYFENEFATTKTLSSAASTSNES